MSEKWPEITEDTPPKEVIAQWPSYEKGESLMSRQYPRITRNMTPEEVMAIHRRIWDYVIDNGEKPVTMYISDCAFCEYCHIHNKKCEDCIANWPGNITCRNFGSLFSTWLMERDKEKSTKLAIQVRDIPMKERYKK